MSLTAGYWKRRYERAEAARLKAVAAASQALQTICEVEQRLDDRATLINIDRNGRKIRFTFVRNKQLTVIETFGTWGDNIDEWRKALLASDTI